MGRILDNLEITFLKSKVFLNKRRLELKEFYKRINLRKELLFKLDEPKKWFEQNTKSIQFLFENEGLRNYIFDKFSVLWEKGEISKDKEIYAIITQVSVANAILAGIPGKLGIGVFVCIALEFYMALAIARRIGFKISEDDSEETELKKWIWEKFKSLAPYGLYFSFVGFIAIYAFKHMFSFVFSIVPGPVAFVVVVTEYIITTFVGILFWTAFEQVNDPKNKKILISSYKKTKDLLIHQKDSIKDTFTRKNIEDTFEKLQAWFTGDLLKDLPNIRGDVFVSVSIGFLLVGKHDAFGGPVGQMFIQSIRDIGKHEAFDSTVGQMFIQSIRDRWPKLENASVEEISSFMSSAYEEDQLEGVVNLIKGKLFENLSVAHENADGDEWTASLHENQSYPGSDMILTNMENGDTIELSLKATENLNYIESALLKYPEYPILTTSEIPEKYPDLEMVIASDFSNSDLQEITKDNFDELVNNLSPYSFKLSGPTAVTAGVSVAAIVAIWPFLAAYKRNIISKEKLIQACEKVFPKAGKELFYRVSLMVVFGPIYGWYVIAKTAMKLTPEPKDSPPKDTSAVKYLVWKKSDTIK